MFLHYHDFYENCVNRLCLCPLQDCGPERLSGLILAILLSAWRASCRMECNAWRERASDNATPRLSTRKRLPAAMRIVNHLLCEMGRHQVIELYSNRRNRQQWCCWVFVVGCSQWWTGIPLPTHCQAPLLFVMPMCCGLIPIQVLKSYLMVSYGCRQQVLGLTGYWYDAIFESSSYDIMYSVCWPNYLIGNCRTGSKFERLYRGKGLLRDSAR